MCPGSVILCKDDKISLSFMSRPQCADFLKEEIIFALSYFSISVFQFDSGQFWGFGLDHSLNMYSM